MLTLNDGAQEAQDLSAPQGKRLRINPLASATAPYTVPAGNPFVDKAGVLPEIFASGLRFPQSFGWDTGGTGQMFINDLGQAALEEVDLGKAGDNYGWSQRAGTLATGYAQGVNDPVNEQLYTTPAKDPAYTDPIAEYWHSEGAALGSGFLYRGTAIPALTGQYVLADIVVGRLFYFDPADAAGERAGHPARNPAFRERGAHRPVQHLLPASGYALGAAAQQRALAAQPGKGRGIRPGLGRRAGAGQQGAATDRAYGLRCAAFKICGHAPELISCASQVLTASSNAGSRWSM